MKKRLVDEAVTDTPLWLGGVCVSMLGCLVSLCLVGGCGRISGKEPPPPPPPAPKTSLLERAAIDGPGRMAPCPEMTSISPSADTLRMPQAMGNGRSRWIKA